MRRSLIETLDQSTWPNIGDHGDNGFMHIWNEYYDFLKQVKDRLPEGVRNFFINDWHYNSDSKRALHDSWLVSATVEDQYAGMPRKYSSRNFSLKLLLPYHDQYLKISYIGITRINGLNFGSDKLGDLMVDELVDIDKSSESWLHRIVWEIEFKDLSFEFESLAINI